MRIVRTTLVLILVLFIGTNFCLSNILTNQDEAPDMQVINDQVITEQFSSLSKTRALADPNKLTLLAEGVGSELNTNFGHAVSGTGDLNNDGFDDIIITAPNANPAGKSNAGEAYLFFGSADFSLQSLDTASADITLYGNTANEYFGKSICIPGDINGDGINDIIIGAPGTASNKGNIYIFYSSSITTSSTVLSDSADIIIQGSSNGDNFGETIIALDDVDSDSEVDIMVGAPGADKAFIIYGPSFGASDRTTFTGPSGSDFGTSVSGGTDLNGDGYLDFVVGAPSGSTSSDNKGQVFIFFGYSNFYQNTEISSSKANNILVSDSLDNLFGQTLTTQLDIDQNDFFDIIVSAPGEDAVFIYYGNTITEKFSYPNLWNMPSDPAHPVDFTSGVYNDVGQELDVNTYGLGNGDDGWDWQFNIFGTSRGSDMDFIYGAKEEPNPPYADADGPTLNDEEKLEVIVGRSNTQLGPTWNPGPIWNRNQVISDSGAWGIEFQITNEMFENISLGGNIYLEFDWEAYDAMEVFGNTGGGTEEQCYVKARFSNSKTSTFLGSDLGGDSTAELFFHESSSILNSPFNSASDHYKANINDLVDSSGGYYLELGARFETTYVSGKGDTEGIVSFFDNIYVWIENLPISHSVKIKGVAQSQFGQSLTVLDDLNSDGIAELAICAPYSNLAGINSGTVYIIHGSSNLRSQINSNEAQRIINGLAENENFGTSFAAAGNLNGDGYNEFIMGAPGHSGQTGKVYVFSPCQIPEIEIINPKGGTTVEGELAVLANVTDFENELDKFGVSYYYSEYNEGQAPTWQLIGRIKTHKGSIRNIRNDNIQYELSWDTNNISDGFYKIKALVTDNTYLSSEDISDLFEVNNPDKPIVHIISPSIENETYNGEMTLRANCTDPDNDLNYTQFYYTQDGETWTLIGTDYSTEDAKFVIKWDTEYLTDGSYKLKVVANDTSGLTSVAKSVIFIVHNPGPPNLGFIQPTSNDTLEGTSKLNVYVNDKDNNIAATGVTFYYSRDRDNWVMIASAANPDPDTTYSTLWETLKIPDGYYYLKADVVDTTNLSAEVILGPILVDNPSPPTIQLESISSLVTGKITIRALCSDDDSDLSSEGVAFYISTNNDSWQSIGKVFLSNAITNGQNSIFDIAWDTDTNDTPDDPNYRVRATVKDVTGLTNESIFGPFEVNNPDPPTVLIDHPKTGDKLSGRIKLGAYADDPDNDIDARGVTFYFSFDGHKWHLIDNSAKSVSNSSLFQLDWDTNKLPNGDYQIKAEVVDKNALTAESIINIKVENAQSEEFLKVSSSFWTGSAICIIIIILLAIFLASILIKRRKRKKELEAEAEREKLLASLKKELLGEPSRYPTLAPAPQSGPPILPAPASTAGTQPQMQMIPKTTAPERPLLPPHSPQPTAGSPSPASQAQAQVQPQAQAHTPQIREEHPYQPKVGLPPDEVQSETTVQAPSTQQQQPQVQAQAQPQPQLPPKQTQQTAAKPDKPKPETKTENDGGGGE